MRIVSQIWRRKRARRKRRQATHNSAPFHQFPRKIVIKQAVVEG